MVLGARGKWSSSPSERLRFRGVEAAREGGLYAPVGFDPLTGSMSCAGVGDGFLALQRLRK